MLWFGGAFLAEKTARAQNQSSWVPSRWLKRILPRAMFAQLGVSYWYAMRPPRLALPLSDCIISRVDAELLR